MPLLIARREIQIGNQIRINTLKHGKENVSGLFVPLSSLAISAEELPEVLLEKNAYKLLYRKMKGRPDQPIWAKASPVLYLPGKVKSVQATLFLGRRQLQVIDGTMAKRTVAFNEGGTSHLAFELQCVPDLDESHPIMEALFSRASEKVDIELECETYGAQPDLPLEEEEDEEESENGEPAEGAAPAEEPETSGLGRAIGRASRPRSRKDA